jgi:hypothetical protein
MRSARVVRIDIAIPGVIVCGVAKTKRGAYDILVTWLGMVPVERAGAVKASEAGSRLKPGPCRSALQETNDKNETSTSDRV